MAISFGFTITSFVVSLIGIVLAVQTGNKILPPDPIPTPFSIPFRYLVNDSLILPPTDQKDLGTCWAFSAIYMLEAAYHSQGVNQGLLSSTQYVSFSKQAFLKFLNDSCQNHPAKACRYGGLKAQDPSDHQIEALYYFAKEFPSLTTSILPESICPYQTNRSLWFSCPNYNVTGNPINFSIKSMTTAYTIDSIKELLVKTGRSLGFGTPLPSLVYWIPCVDFPFNETDACVAQTYPCPEYGDALGAHCYRAELDARDQTGVFLGGVDPKFMAELGGHAMNLVGYNDDWLYRNRFQSAPASAHKGGFILHNSWRSGGHSAEYLFGNLSEENEAVICPNHVAPVNWIPATLQCVEENAARITGGFLNCSDDIERIRGRGRTKSADLLYCKSELCNVSAQRLYVLERVGNDVNVKFTPSGTAEVGLITIENGSVPYRVGRTTIKGVPFWALSQLFAPVNTTFVPNDQDNCGYWMLPYDTLENMKRINWDLLDNFRVVDLEIEFSQSSYSLSVNASDYNFEWVTSSTKSRNKAKFNGPVPFDLIY